jgi:hypothetical protein
MRKINEKEVVEMVNELNTLISTADETNCQSTVKRVNTIMSTLKAHKDEIAYFPARPALKCRKDRDEVFIKNLVDFVPYKKGSKISFLKNLEGKFSIKWMRL